MYITAIKLMNCNEFVFIQQGSAVWALEQILSGDLLQRITDIINFSLINRRFPCMKAVA